MRNTIGTRFREVLLESGVGQHPDDPVEAQRLYVAALQGTPAGFDPRVPAPYPMKVWVTASLNDIDVAARLVIRRTIGQDRKCAQGMVRSVATRARRIEQTAAFKMRPVKSARAPLPSWEAFRLVGRRGDYPVLSPVAELLPGRAEAGVLWPYQFTSPPSVTRWAVYQFTPSGQPRPERVEAALVARPAVGEHRG